MDSALQNSIPFFVKQHIIASLIGFVLGVFIHLVSLGDSTLEGSTLLLQVAISGSIGICLAFLLSLLSRQMNKVVSWKDRTGFRFLSGLLLNAAIVFMLIRALDFLWLEQQDPYYITKLYLLSFIALILYSVLYFALYSYHAYAQEQLNEVKVLREQIDLQYAALRSQLSPHFLFNGLNTISALVHQDKSRAKAFIRSLASCYDFVLDNYKLPLIRLEEELKFVEAYVFLLQTRFENNIELRVDLASDIQESFVPPLAIQMLVENASKHNVISENQKLQISITTKKGIIKVSNNKTQTPNKISSFKIGLNNIFSRYKLLGYAARSENNELDFIVSLPIITAE